MRILDAAGVLRGTGFVVDEKGSVLTCHHVVDGMDPIRLEGHGGATSTVSAGLVTLVPESDLALVPATSVLGDALPIAPTAEPALTDYRTEGFHKLGDEIRSSFPVDGRVTGTATVWYATELTEYQIPGALVLRDDEFGPGLSGAPVLDRSSGVVIGVVSTMLRSGGRAGGFAVRLSVDHAPSALREVLAVNAVSAPAYGDFLNVAGMRALCQAQVRQALDELATRRGVDLDRRVDRGTTTAQLRAAVAGDQTLVALVGPSGVGKTTELAALAAGTDLPVVLLRGSSISPQTTHVGSAVAVAIAQVAGRGEVTTDTDTLARVARDEGGLLVVLDALNESPLCGHPLEEWLGGSLPWLRDSGAQMVVSSRPEFWDSVPTMLRDSRKPSVEVVRLGEFTDEEALAAAARFGLRLNEQVGALRLPVVLRLSADAADAPRGQVALSVNDVMAKYVSEAARRVASGIGGQASAATVLDWLGVVAARMLATGEDSVDRVTFHEVFPAALLAGDRVIAEHLMSRTPLGFRFVYDDVADWLKATQIDLDQELTDDGLRLLGAGAGWRRVGAVGYALREVARLEGAAALAARLDGVLDAVDRLGRPPVVLLQDTFAKVGDLSPYLDTLHKFARVFAGQFREFDTTSFWASLALPLDAKLSLLQVLVPTANYWPWRPQDWADAAIWGARFNFASLALELVRERPAEGLAAIAAWLSDHTRLEEDEATVAYVAMGIAYRLRDADPEAVWRMVCSHHEDLSRLFDELGRSDPVFLAHLLAAHGENPEQDEAFVAAASALELRQISSPDQEEVVRLLRTIAARAQDPEVRRGALVIVAKAAGDPDAIQAVLALFVQGNQRVDAYTVAALATWAPEEVVGAFGRLARSHPTRQADLLIATNSLSDASAQSAWDVEVADLVRSGEFEVSFDLGWYVEMRVRNAHRLTPAIEELAQALIQGPPGGGRRCLARAVTSPTSLASAPADRRRLAHELVAAQADEGTLFLVLERIAAEPKGQRSLLVEVLARVDPVKADRILMGEAYRTAKFAAALDSWLRKGKAQPPGRLVRRFVELTAGGLTPTAAAGAVVDEEI